MLRSSLWWLLGNMIAAGLLSLLANLYPGAYMETTEAEQWRVRFNNCPVDGYHVPRKTELTLTCIAAPSKGDIQVHVYFDGRIKEYRRVNACQFSTLPVGCLDDRIARGYMDFTWFTGAVNGVTFTYKDNYPYLDDDVDAYNVTFGCDEGVECWIYYSPAVPTTTPVPNEDELGGLGAGPIAGIVIIIIVLAACTIGAYFVWRKKFRKPAEEIPVKDSEVASSVGPQSATGATVRSVNEVASSDGPQSDTGASNVSKTSEEDESSVESQQTGTSSEASSAGEESQAYV